MLGITNHMVSLLHILPSPLIPLLFPLETIFRWKVEGQRYKKQTLGCICPDLAQQIWPTGYNLLTPVL